MSARTDGAMLSAEELGWIREKHRVREDLYEGCWDCGTDWPCESAKLLAHIDAMAAENAALTARLALAEAVIEAARAVHDAWAAGRGEEGLIELGLALRVYDDATGGTDE